MKEKKKMENDYMNSIKNPLYRFLYGLIRFHTKEVLLILLATAICLNLADVNIKEIIGKLIDKIF